MEAATVWAAAAMATAAAATWEAASQVEVAREEAGRPASEVPLEGTEETEDARVLPQAARRRS